MQPEREVSNAKAYHNALLYLKSKNLYTNFNLWISNNLTLKIIQCDLLNYQNKKVSTGMGKGINFEPILGAVFEALEHYTYENQKISTRRMSLKETLLNNAILLEDVAIKVALKENIHKKILVTRFSNIYQNKSDLYYPTSLIDTNVNDNNINYNSHIYQYSSNSGYASGSTISEAMLHSINELIERDSFSKLLIKYGMNKDEDIIAYQIDIQTLPKKLYKLFKDIETTTNGTLSLVKINNKFQIPTYVAILKNKRKYIFPLYGAGTSLIEEYAVERALTEVFQASCVFNSDDVNMFKYMKNLWHKVPGMIDLISFDFIKKIKYSKYICNNQYRDVQVKKLLSSELNILSNCNVNIYIRRIIDDINFNVVQCLIPQFSKFNLVLEGKVLLPYIE